MKATSCSVAPSSNHHSASSSAVICSPRRTLCACPGTDHLVSQHSDAAAGAGGAAGLTSPRWKKSCCSP